MLQFPKGPSSPEMLSLSNVMHKLLTKFYTQYPQYKPVLHTRLVDDIFILWDKSLTELNAFLDTLNSFHSSIKFEITYSTNEINFLDTTVYIDHSSSTLHTKLYSKLGMGDTDDTSIYRDTKISRYWYRVCLDTFWYRDTKSIAILCRYFCRYYTCGKTFNTLFS